MTLLTNIYKIQSDVGMIKAEKNASKWIREARQDDMDLTVAKPLDQKGYLEAGKISIFSYNPKGKSVLDYYDKKPVVISLGQIKQNGRVYDLAINLNFIPAPYKWYILNTINKLYSGFYKTQILGRNSNNALLQAKIQYKYEVLKQLLKQYNVSYAIRTYIPSRKSRVYVLSYETWAKVAFLSIENFEGISYVDMIKKYKASK